jgi:hypothetical protein
MELKPFIRTLVRPGQPLTAQGWNDLVDGIDAVHAFLRATLHVVTVRITNAGLDTRDVRVTAVRSDRPPVEAVRPTEGDGVHTLSGLEAGAWTLVATAVGYRAATASVTIADEGNTDVQLALEVTAHGMPDLFGLDLATAIARLQDAGIPLTRLLDFEGTDYAPANPGREELTQPVLAQSPAPGWLLDSAATSRGAAVVIAVPAQLESVVEVPSLAGLTQDEAKRVLENLGLRVGKTTVLQPRA